MALFGYGLGIAAPGIKDMGVSPYKVGHTALMSHASAYHLYQKHFKAIQEGNLEKETLGQTAYVFPTNIIYVILRDS